ncbi:MAG: DUF3105 domain-containing protein [Mycobacteriales bacterium]
MKKPFPVGFALGVAALAAALIGILVYAVVNQGIGDKSSLKYAQHQISDLHSTSGLGRQHKEGVIAYPHQASTPPDGGNHNGVPESCQVYTEPIANEHAVHSLEHGAVWVTYDPAKLSKADVDVLKKLVDGDPYRMLSPYPGLKSPISLQAWGEQLFVDKVSDTRIKRFLDLFTNGPQTKEPGSACQGTTATGPMTTAAPTPGAGASTMPASPTPKK